MNDVMLRLLAALLLVAAVPAFAQDRADAVLVLADDGALDASAVHAIRNVAAGAPRKRGLAPSEDRRADGVRPGDGALASLPAEVGARRLVALRIGGRA